jgi:hypothetical protein
MVLNLTRAGAASCPEPSEGLRRLLGFAFDFSPLCHPACPDRSRRDRSTPLVSRVPFTGTAGFFFRAVRGLL